AFTLQKLAIITGNEQYTRYATTILRLLADQIRRYPSAFGWTLCALDFYLSTPKEVVIVGPAADPEIDLFARAAWEPYLPNRVICSCAGDCENAQNLIPLLEGRVPSEEAVAYLCEA